MAIQRTKSGKMDKRTNDYKEFAAKMSRKMKAVHRKKEASLMSRIKKLFKK